MASETKRTGRDMILFANRGIIKDEDAVIALNPLERYTADGTTCTRHQQTKERAADSRYLDNSKGMHLNHEDAIILGRMCHSAVPLTCMSFILAAEILDSLRMSYSGLQCVSLSDLACKDKIRPMRQLHISHVACN